MLLDVFGCDVLGNEDSANPTLPGRPEPDLSARDHQIARRVEMTLSAASRFQFTADLNICRILNGMWQVSGGHGTIDPVRAIEAMFAYHDAGFTTWDLADHYGPAEDLIGTFRREFAEQRGSERLSEIQAFTKWVLARAG